MIGDDRRPLGWASGDSQERALVSSLPVVDVHG